MPTLISRKIWVAENFWIFYTVCTSSMSKLHKYQLKKCSSYWFQNDFFLKSKKWKLWNFSLARLVWWKFRESYNLPIFGWSIISILVRIGASKLYEFGFWKGLLYVVDLGHHTLVQQLFVCNLCHVISAEKNILPYIFYVKSGWRIQNVQNCFFQQF